jgi:hypothetical protein
VREMESEREGDFWGKKKGGEERETSENFKQRKREREREGETLKNKLGKGEGEGKRGRLL